jgi:hypothetical protein
MKQGAIFKCLECNVPIETYYRNERVDYILGAFIKRRQFSLSFLEWMRNINLFLPEAKKRAESAVE